MLIYEKSNTQAPFNLTVDLEGAGGITGATPTIAMRDATTTDSYLDWDDLVFKTVGWTTKYKSMDEVERGHYTAIVNLASIAGISIGSILSMEYHLDEGGALLGEDQETLIVVETIMEIATDAAAQVASSGAFLSTAQASQLKEIWQILGLDSSNPLVVSKTQRSAGTEIDQSVQVDVPAAGSVTVTKV